MTWNRKPRGRGVYAQLTTPLYRPIDELLEIPVVKLLRTLRRFEWASFDELVLAMELSDDPGVRNYYSSQLGRLARNGLVDTRVKTHRRSSAFSDFRINAKGQHELELIMARADVDIERTTRAARCADADTRRAAS